MENRFNTIHEAFENAGVDIKTAQYNITDYSLNTKLSFKFKNIEEFFAFLNINRVIDEEKEEEITRIIVEAGIDPQSFFYVNFYRPKVAEL